MSDATKPPGAATNRLARESSPYLLLHRHNPVDWYPWGEEAIERARELDRPIFLSVGYSTCYWCHVMERESFSDPSVAGLMNREFINVKVDREERPDLDEVYMVATQVLSGQGGWPNSVFLTPALEPFFAGTYFPPQDRYGQPAFSRVLTSLADAWKNRRDDIEEQAGSVTGAMKRHLERRTAPAPAPPDAGVAHLAVEALERTFDAAHGGFGGAPKFPSPSNLSLLLEAGEEGSRAHEMLTATLDAMARGGICDQLGGGFHRYATDAEWRIPHFEKMLYDNGLLLELYALEWERGADPEMARVVRETASFLERKMRDETGFFWSALDAETDGEEGAYYVWTRSELEEVLGDEDFQFAAPLLGFDGPPFFEGSYYVLHLPKPLAEQAAARRMPLDEVHQALDPIRRRLLEVRQTRQPIATDDKVLTDWNGMAIAGLATAGRLLPDPALVASAETAARAVHEHLRVAGGGLAHTWRRGEARVEAFLSDYVFLTHGLIALFDATGQTEWLDAARETTEEQIARLRDPLGGFFNAAERSDLLVRGKELIDGAVPAANGVAVVNLLALAERTGESRWRDEAEAALKAFATELEQAPQGARTMSTALLRFDPETRSGDSAELRRETPMQKRAAAAVGVHLELGAADDEGWRPFELRLEIESGLHLQANPAGADYLVPTEVHVSSAELAAVEYPPGERLASAFDETPIPVYTGRAEIRGRVRGEGTLHLGYQACSDTGCLPVVRVDLPLARGSAAEP